MLVAACTAGPSACTGELLTRGDLGARPSDGGAHTDASATARDSGGMTERDGAVRDADSSSDHLTPVFVAQGDLGRRMLSCDDGNTWIHDRSWDQHARCYEGGFDCSHHRGTPTGLSYGEGHFFMSWGWGAPGSLERSSAVGPWDWEVVQSEPWLGRALAGNGVVLLAGVVVRRSTDQGMTFSPEQPVGLRRDHVREAAFVPTAGGLFVLVGEGGGEPSGPPQDVVLSPDGLTWRNPDSIPVDCGKLIIERGGIAGTTSTVVILSGDGTVCASNDAGATWQLTQAAPAVSPEETSAPVQVGDAIAFWSVSGMRYISSNGVQWQSEPVHPGRMELGPVARHPETGTFVGISAGSQYEGQRIYRSADGLTWTPLGPEAFMASHAIHAVEAGFVQPSVCEN